jgi:hypothetical protein
LVSAEAAPPPRLGREKFPPNGGRGDLTLTASNKDYSAFATSPAGGINHPNACGSATICNAMAKDFTAQGDFPGDDKPGL